MRTANVLNAEQTAALQAVTLDMHFVSHGIIEVDPVVGDFTAFVGDAEYIDSTAVLRDLDPARGDILAIESFGHPDEPVSAVPFFGFVSRSLDQSNLRDPAIQRDNYRALLEDARRVRSLPTTDYATGHALLRGIEVHIADMGLARRQALAQKYGTSDGNKLMNIPEARRERDIAIVQELGNGAVKAMSGRWQKVKEGAEPPTVGSAHGSAHLTALRGMLRAAEIQPNITRHGRGTIGQWLHPSEVMRRYNVELGRLYDIAAAQALDTPSRAT
jgi:hypothetical protein